MKSIERKIKSAEERVQRLKGLSREIASFQHYQASPNFKDIAERNLHREIRDNYLLRSGQAGEGFPSQDH